MLQPPSMHAHPSLFPAKAVRIGARLVASVVPFLLARGQSLQPAPEGALADATVAVTRESDGKIGSAFAGFSYEKAELTHPLMEPGDSGLIALFKLLGPSILRIGGDSSDKMSWAPLAPNTVYPNVDRAQVDRLAKFVRATGWRCLYTVNLAGSAKGTQTPEKAADEAAYAAQAFGPDLVGIEIGNEPDAYHRPGRQYADKPWDLERYEALWNQYRTAILAKTPGLVITGPAAGHLAVWTIPFSKAQTKAKLALLTDHYYAGRGHSRAAFTGEILVSPDTLLASNLKLMRDAQNETGIPFYIGETNSFAGSVPGVSDSYAASLWIIDFLFNCAQGGAMGAALHGGGSAAYSPLADDRSRVTEIKPEFYGILLFTMAGTGTLERTTVSAGGRNVTAYAVRTETGTNIVVVNKDAATSLKLDLQLPSAAQSADALCLDQHGPGGPSLAAKSGVVIQGSAVETDGRFSPGEGFALAPDGAHLHCFVPRLSAVLIRTR